jgi:hypothetical protein
MLPSDCVVAAGFKAYRAETTASACMLDALEPAAATAAANWLILLFNANAPSTS